MDPIHPVGSSTAVPRGNGMTGDEAAFKFTRARRLRRRRRRRRSRAFSRLLYLPVAVATSDDAAA